MGAKFYHLSYWRTKATASPRLLTHLLLELAPPTPSLISPLLSPALHGRPPRPRPLPWLSLPPHHPLRPPPPHLPPPRPRSSPTGPRRPHCPCLYPPTAFLPMGCAHHHHPTTPPWSPLAPPCPHPHLCCRCQGTLGPQPLTPFLVSLGSWQGGVVGGHGPKHGLSWLWQGPRACGGSGSRLKGRPVHLGPRRLTWWRQILKPSSPPLPQSRT